MNMIYADNAATTPMSPAAIRAMLPYLDELWGNPSSAHPAGILAKQAVDQARQLMADQLGCTPNELIFTSGGSESDNQALITCAAIGKKTGKRHILSTNVEHHAILHTLDRLKKEGFEIELLPVNEDGLITVSQVEAALREDTLLVSVMYANNEIGTVMPIREIGRLCRSRKVYFHTDAVQACGHLPVNVTEDQIDLLSLSAHKFHGPKGIGVLYVRRGIPVTSLILGGGQEYGKRAGTTNVAAIAAMAEAFRESCQALPEESRYVSSLRDQLIRQVLMLPYTAVNGSLDARLPGNASFCFEGIDGAQLLLALNEAGICASAGSACQAGSGSPSHVIRAIGRNAELANTALRISLSRYNTPEEIDMLADTIKGIVTGLRSSSTVWRAKEQGKRPFYL